VDLGVTGSHQDSLVGQAIHFNAHIYTFLGLLSAFIRSFTTNLNTLFGIRLASLEKGEELLVGAEEGSISR